MLLSTLRKPFALFTAAIQMVLFYVVAIPNIYGETYYINPDTGDNLKDGLSMEDTPWRTIGKANAELKEGDTVRIAGGSYAESINPVNSGRDGLAIIYQNHDEQDVIIRDVARGVNISAKSYISVIGLNFTETAYYVHLEESHHILIENCTMDYLQVREGWPTGIRVRADSHHNTFRGCTIGRAGYSTDSDDKGGVVVIGTWLNTNDHCDYNLFENNDIFYGGHHLIELVGRFNMIRNNYFHNEEWMDCSRPGGKCGNRSVIIGYDNSQCNRNLIEGNRFAFSGVPADQNTSVGLSVRTNHNIVRNNVFYHNDGPGLGISTGTTYPDASHNLVYNNTFYHNGYTLLDGVENWKQGGFLIAKHGSTTPSTDIAIKNNLFHDNNLDAIVYYYVDADAQVTANNWEHAGDPLFQDIAGAVTPGNPSLPDLRLTAASPCKDAGTYLTTIIGSGSGRQFKVLDAGYFTDGWTVRPGDVIQLEGRTDRVRITGINYETNTITVNSDLSWTDGTGVSLAYAGDSPDIGAHEYGLEDDEPEPNPSPSGSDSTSGGCFLSR